MTSKKINCKSCNQPYSKSYFKKHLKTNKHFERIYNNYLMQTDRYTYDYDCLNNIVLEKSLSKNIITMKKEIDILSIEDCINEKENNIRIIVENKMIDRKDYNIWCEKKENKWWLEKNEILQDKKQILWSKKYKDFITNVGLENDILNYNRTYIKYLKKLLGEIGGVFYFNPLSTWDISNKEKRIFYHFKNDWLD